MAPVDSREYVISGIYYSVLEPRRCAKHIVAPSKHETLTQCWSNARLTASDSGRASNQHWFNTSYLLGLRSIARWSAYCWRRVQADTDPMSVKCWASIAGAGQYPFSTSQYFMLAVPACWRYWHDALNQSWVHVVWPSVMLAHIQRGAKNDTVTQYSADCGSAS